MSMFYKHATYLAALFLMTNIHTQCMFNEDTTTIDSSKTGFINLKDQPSVTNALISSANNLINEKRSSSKLAGIDLFNRLILEKNGYEAAEKACLSIFDEKNNTKVTIALLNLLKALNTKGQAFETSLLLSTKIFITTSQKSKFTDLRDHAIQHLHELIVVKNIDLIPQEAIEAAMLGCNDKNNNIKGASQNIIKVILHKWQSPASKASYSEESNNEEFSSEDSDLEKIKRV